MKTYQDIERLGGTGLIDFLWSAVREHQQSERYRTAKAAESYYAKKNETIMKFQKVLFNLQGLAVPDVWSANYKLRTTFFRRFVLQQVQFVLANGVTFENEQTKKKLGGHFDTQLQKMAKKAMVDGVCFGFWNYDHLEVFPFCDTENDPGFAPLYDEETGELRAGIRYWNTGAAERMTFYEVDGYTDFIKKKDKEAEVLNEKRSYKQTIRRSQMDGESVVGSENYSRLPIIPMYANDLKESELEGIRENIDCYDFIKSGLANEIDDTAGVYWLLKNSGGMDDVNLAKFIERMHVVRAATIDSDEGQAAEAHTLDVPVEAREAMLNRLEEDLYNDFQIINVAKISGGNKTATEITAAYQPMNDKCGDFEYCMIEFIQSLLGLMGIEDNPSFRYNKITNQTEETNMVLAAAQYLGDELVLKKLPFLTPEEVENRLKEMSAEELSRFNGGTEWTKATEEQTEP